MASREPARPEDMTEKGMVLTGDRNEAAAAAAAAQLAHSGSVDPKSMVSKKSGPHVVPRVHPSLQQALAEIDVEDELDIPAFLRRHNTPPVG